MITTIDILGNGFFELFSGAPPDWGGIFANQRQAYYDIWALRHRKWCPEDCWQQVGRSQPVGRFRRFFSPMRGVPGVEAVERYVGRRQVRIAPEHGPIEVDSAFGGFGVYRTSFLCNAWYSGRDAAGREVCDHVHFNSCVRRAGGKLYIIPALLNDAPAEHLAPGSGATARPWE